MRLCRPLPQVQGRVVHGHAAAVYSAGSQAALAAAGVMHGIILSLCNIMLSNKQNQCIGALPGQHRACKAGLACRRLEEHSGANSGRSSNGWEWSDRMCCPSA